MFSSQQKQYLNIKNSCANYFLWRQRQTAWPNGDISDILWIVGFILRAVRIHAAAGMHKVCKVPYQEEGERSILVKCEHKSYSYYRLLFEKPFVIKMRYLKGLTHYLLRQKTSPPNFHQTWPNSKKSRPKDQTKTAQIPLPKISL